MKVLVSRFSVYFFYFLLEFSDEIFPEEVFTVQNRLSNFID